MTGKREGEEKKAPEFDIGIDLGGLFGGIFKGINDLADLAAELAEKGEVVREGAFDFEDRKGRFGFAMKTGVADDTEFRVRTSERKKTGKREEIREPLIDMFEEEDETVIYVELPGVEQQDIKTELKQGRLHIEAEHRGIKYKKEIELSERAKGEPSYEYKNGILKVRFAQSER
ncbi:MAG: Hsp20/alpha crystallin family protein [Candidatus Bipolaricaulia bacterium]